MQVRNNQNFYKKYSIKLCSLLMFINFPVFAQQEESVYQRFAPIELTGNWVSVITEDWHIRMITPPQGNFDGLPLSQSAQEDAMNVDIGQLERDGQACLAYGAARLLREPGRLKILWEDNNTLRINTDAGAQTRLLHFDNTSTPSAPSLQGHSIAEWQYAGGYDTDRELLNPGQINSRVFNTPALAAEPVGGKLYVETVNLVPALLRKNGVFHSSDTEVKEYFNTLREPDGTEWLIVTTIVRDPVNLIVEYITSSNFQREADSSKWDPTPCTLVR